MKTSITEEAAMQTALSQLIQAAPVCKPIKADLRASTLTFDWPANVLVQRTDYLLVPAREVGQAMAQDQQCVVFARKGECRVSMPPYTDDLNINVDHDNSQCNIYFNRFHRDSRPAGVWWGRQSITDTAGRDWDSSLGEMVTDDFGTLVNRFTGVRP